MNWKQHWKQLGFGKRKEATLQEEFQELHDRWDDLVKEVGEALVQTRCLILGHRWRCLGRWSNDDEYGRPRSLMSVWDCERPGCHDREIQQWDIVT